MTDVSILQSPNQRIYTLDAGDTLGVFVETVMGDFGSMPPIHQPPVGSDLPPAMGYPTLVLHDGTIRLPLVDPISVRGLSVAQVESLLKKKYREASKPVISTNSRVIVSLIRKRTINVMVVRSDQSSAQTPQRFQQMNQGKPVSARSDGSGRVYNLNLPAGDNDLLNALIESGGLPGVNAEDHLNVLRNLPNAQSRTDAFPRSGRDQSDRRLKQEVPVRSYGAKVVPPFPRTQARLNDGDIVSVASKPTEVFYTGGLLGGGEYLIPRDRPLSVMDAISQVGGIPQPQRGIGAIPLQQPQVLTLLRNHGGRQSSQRFDLSGGFSQQASRTFVRSGDYLILNYSPRQRAGNVGIGVLNTYGLRQLLGN